MARVFPDRGGLGEVLCLEFIRVLGNARKIAVGTQCGVGKALKIFLALTLLNGQYGLFFSAARCIHCMC
jgi:hypothetical protein